MKKRIEVKVGVLCVISILLLSGCGSEQEPKTDIAEESIEKVNLEQSEGWQADMVMGILTDVYEQATTENKLADLEMIRNIVNYLGEYEYSAVDSRNQIDMTQKEQVKLFCEQVDNGEYSELTIIEVTYDGGFIEYDFQTQDGNVDVVKYCYSYQNGAWEKTFSGSYVAEDWDYTDEGYLMFSGEWFSEELYVLTLSTMEEHLAFRVEPLDERCRELNRKYLLPIGYERNNMFLVDWSENDFGELDFYDMYDIFYSLMGQKTVPFVPDDNLGVSAVYQIPKEEFENVIMTYFNIESETLQAKTIYNPEKATYEYKPRGFEEVEYPEYPFSEVIDYVENNDGTIKLTVHVVFPYAGISKVYAHETVVRPMENGAVQYVSNRIIPSEDNHEETWHVDRLTAAEWEELYGGE